MSIHSPVFRIVTYSNLINESGITLPQLHIFIIVSIILFILWIFHWFILCFLLLSYFLHISVILIFTFPIFTCLLILIAFISSFHFSNCLSPYKFFHSWKIPVDHAWNFFLTSKSKQSPRPTTLLLHIFYFFPYSSYQFKLP